MDGKTEKPKVLIVDDDAQILTILRDTLARYSDRFEVATAGNGLEAIQAVQQGTFPVVVTDIQMPKVNGLVLLAYLSKNFPAIECIIMTGHGSEFLRERFKIEAVGYFEKPFAPPELAEAVLAAIARSREKKGGPASGVSMISFLKLIEIEEMTCLCEIRAANGAKGYLLFEDGSLYNAFHLDKRGEAAALSLLRLKDVTITFRQPPAKKIQREIHRRVTQLIQEA